MNGSQQQQQQPPNHSVSHPPSLYMCTPTFIDPVSCHHIHLYPYALAHHVMLIVYQSTSSCFVLSTQIMCCSVSPIRPAPDGQPGPPPPSFLHSGRVVEEMPRDTPPSHTRTHIHTYTHTHTHTYPRHQQTRHRSTLALDSRVWQRPSAMRMPSRHGLCRR